MDDGWSETLSTVARSDAILRFAEHLGGSMLIINIRLDMLAVLDECFWLVSMGLLYYCIGLFHCFFFLRFLWLMYDGNVTLIF